MNKKIILVFIGAIFILTIMGRSVLGIPGLPQGPATPTSPNGNFTSVTYTTMPKYQPSTPAWSGTDDTAYVPMLPPPTVQMVADFEGPIYVSGEVRLGPGGWIVDNGKNGFGLRTIGLSGLYAEGNFNSGSGVLGVGKIGVLGTGESYGIFGTSNYTGVKGNGAIGIWGYSEYDSGCGVLSAHNNKETGQNNTIARLAAKDYAVYGENNKAATTGYIATENGGVVGIGQSGSRGILAPSGGLTNCGVFGEGAGFSFLGSPIGGIGVGGTGDLAGGFFIGSGNDSYGLWAKNETSVGAFIDGKNSSGNIAEPIANTVPKGALFVKNTTVAANGDAITGIAKGGGEGVEGYSESGYGVYGASGADSNAAGVKGQFLGAASSTYGELASIKFIPEVLGMPIGGTGVGVHGSGGGVGVYGHAPSGAGIVGRGRQGIIGVAEDGQNNAGGALPAQYSGEFRGGKGVKIEKALTLVPVDAWPANPEPGTMCLRLSGGEYQLAIYQNETWRRVLTEPW